MIENVGFHESSYTSVMENTLKEQKKTENKRMEKYILGKILTQRKLVKI